MASLKIQREPIRASFLKAVGALQVELVKDEFDAVLVDVLFKRLQSRREKLTDLDKKVELELLASSGTTEQEFSDEYEAVVDYVDKYTDIEAIVSAKMNPREEYQTANGNRNADDAKTKYRLPKLELKKFGGDPKEWLGFWSQFSSIFDDERMAPQDKFQYLIQATLERSAARSVVESFPPTAENFPKCVDYMKSRFGNEDVLREVYVRDLLQLVIRRSEKTSVARLYDQLETQLRALESLGVTKDNNVALLFPMVESALSEDTLQAWERSPLRVAAEGNRLSRLMEFLKLEVESEIRMKMAKTGFGEDKGGRSGGKKRDDRVPTANELFSGQGSKSSPSCVFCDRNHISQDCQAAAKMPYEEKQSHVKKKGACFRCLRKGHFGRACTVKKTCQACGGTHHTMMCKELPQKKQSNEQAAPESSSSSTLSNHTMTGVLLQTLEVCVKIGDKKCYVRAIVDTGSQHSYLTKKVVDHLGLKPIRDVKMAHCLFGGQQTKETVHRVFSVEVGSRDLSYSLKADLMDQVKICGHIASVPQGPWLKELEGVGITLSDVGTEGRDINMLFGADLAGLLFTGRMYPTKSGPVAMETCLGWTLMGKCQRENTRMASSMLSTTLHVSDVDLQDLWRLDLIGITDAVETKSRSELTDAALKHFEETVAVNKEGRYEVSLPWIEGHPPVSQNRLLAEKRLKSAYKKIKDKGYVADYQKIFDEWVVLGVIEKVEDEDDETPGGYLPHHPVFKPMSKTTPIRPVFDASAKIGGMPSLNDCLEKGPNLIELIPDVLLRFRLKKFGVVSDVKKAFLQISVKEEDRNFLKFLWWEEGHLQVYRHCRVVFGVNSSPFLLAATINHHLNNADESLGDIVEIFRKSLYVDNSVTSLDTEEELFRYVDVSKLLLSSAMMDLRGWVWNGATSSTMKCEEDDEIVPVLGLLWNRKTDKLGLDLRSLAVEDDAAPYNRAETSGVDSLISSECGLGVGRFGTVPASKRRILSAAQSVFDPLGITCAVTIVPKILLQELWLRKLSWDESLDEETTKRFNCWKKSLASLKELEVPRWVLQEYSGNVTLHVFSDASKAAYAACVFVRTETYNKVEVQLLMAKSRVSSTKKMTIPRLELLGCLIAARLAKKCKEVMDLQKVKTYYWTDSSNALYWIQKNDCWATFVWNRVQEIQKLSSPEDWRHVPGELNPADLPSRGCSAMTLVQSRWWEGPTWLKQCEEQWPKSDVNVDMELVLAEKRKTVVSHLTVKVDTLSLHTHLSSYRRTVRMIGWMRRWANNAKEGALKLKGHLTPDEESSAEMCLLKIVQRGFSNTDAVVMSLNSFQDALGLWRVKTRILMRQDLEDFKCPILLPTGHPVTKMLVLWEHLRRHHCGNQVLMNALREKFWIPKARKLVREVISSCGRCRRFTAKRVEACTAPLPLDRVRDAAVFEVTGVDLGGPLYLKDGSKVWFSLYTCAVYRAVHLELLTNLSTEGFLQSLRRFIARRGRPTTIYTDNGTNFEGSNNALKKLDWAKIVEETGVEQIRWIFNPPSAPWWGGFWERLVGVVKVLLRRILGKACLEYEELLTVMCDVEAIVNSRPLTYLSEDPQELQPITPAMFLTEIRGHGVPDLDRVDAKSLKKRLQYRQKLRDDLRRRFRDEYLGYLVERGSRRRSKKEIRVDDVVLVEFDNKKRMDWPLGRVLELFPGRDGVHRVARVKTAAGELTRPVQRLFPLELGAQEEDGAEDPLLDAVKAVGVGEELKTAYRTRSGRVSKIPQRFMD